MSANMLMVVTASGGLHLRARPSRDSESLRILPTGAQVTLAQEPGTPEGWTRIMAEEMAGFVASRYLAPVSTAAPMSLPPTGLPPGGVDRRSADTALLHPDFRSRAAAVLAQLAAESIPFRLFEAFRSPARQAHLFAQGRTRPGDKVTNAKPWESYHQYGLAADFVLFEAGNWSWDASGSRRDWWDRLATIGRDNGLEPLTWERPHLQLVGHSIGDLQVGKFPANGDTSWLDNLVWHIESWPGGGPPNPAARPPMPA